MPIRNLVDALATTYGRHCSAWVRGHGERPTVNHTLIDGGRTVSHAAHADWSARSPVVGFFRHLYVRTSHMACAGTSVCRVMNRRLALPIWVQRFSIRYSNQL